MSNLIAFPHGDNRERYLPGCARAASQICGVRR